ncbi:MAG: acetyl-CoA hydrolase/transferase C-terminal domain-containing protein [Candidatus Nanopelagicales bacterium]|nr:acetyl-CoA hydrolase/transferase C-terminal domain-containing protein [Candidatus Nanopelagicales bacterium]
MAKHVSVDRLRARLSSLPANPRVIVSGNLATPQAAIDLIDESLDTYTLHILNALRTLPDRDGVTLETAFVGSGMRGSPRLRYLPCRLSLVPSLLHRKTRPDVVIIHTSMPQDGSVSLGIEVNILPAAVESALESGGLVVALANPQMPFTFGDAVIHLDDVDYLVEIDEPVPSVTNSSNDISDQIGSLISGQVRDGATIQLGVGSLPDAAAQAMTDRRYLKVWTEALGDGILHLERAGALDQDSPIQTSLIIGSAEVLDWIDRNRRVSMLRTERCNSPALISRHWAMTSINTALQIDLHGQTNASWVRQRIYSGFGGSTDFIVGAMHAPAGQSFIALPSWHPRAKCSTIVGQLDGPATSFQQTAAVTDQGIAWLFGESERQQARNLIEHAAHPDARPGLREAAARMGLG